MKYIKNICFHILTHFITSSAKKRRSTQQVNLQSQCVSEIFFMFVFWLIRSNLEVSIYIFLSIFQDRHRKSEHGAETSSSGSPERLCAQRGSHGSFVKVQPINRLLDDHVFIIRHVFLLPPRTSDSCLSSSSPLSFLAFKDLLLPQASAAVTGWQVDVFKGPIIPSGSSPPAFESAGPICQAVIGPGQATLLGTPCRHAVGSPCSLHV